MNTQANILVVDDEPNVRLVFRTALESAGYKVQEAKDGEEALARLAGGGHDLVVLDLKMPTLDGSAVLEAMRERRMETPVVVVTAHGSIPDAVFAMKHGALDFLSKPLTPESLRNVVREVLERPRSTPPTSMTPAADDYASNMKRAKLALGRRSFAEGEFHLKRAIGMKPDAAEAHNLLGILHELRDEHDASHREYSAAIKADQHYEPARNNLTRYYQRFTHGRTQVSLDPADA